MLIHIEIIGKLAPFKYELRERCVCVTYLAEWPPKVRSPTLSEDPSVGCVDRVLLKDS